MNRRSFILRMVVASVLVFAGSAYGQVSGRVVDSHGRPLPAVPVELWTGTRRLGVQPTSAEGRFQFNAPPASGALRLTARILGYAPIARNVGSSSGELTIEMVAVAVELEGLTIVAAPTLRCPRQEDAGSRALWASLSPRYDHVPDSLGISFYARRYDSTVPRERIGDVDEDRLTRIWYGARGSSRRLNAFHTSPYAYGYPITTSLDPAYAMWRYRALGSIEATHFLDEAFGRSHTFHTLARREDGVVLGFCPAGNAGKGPTLEGTLTIRRDTTLVKAEWRFRAPGRDEEAGGEITFVPRDRDLIPLLPAHTLFWRRIAGRSDLYFQRWERFATYQFLPRDQDPVTPTEWLSER